MKREKEAGQRRRHFLKAAAGLGIAIPLTPVLVRAQDAAAIRPKEGDLLVKATASAPQALTVDDVIAGSVPLMAWGMDPADGTIRSGSRFNRVALLRLDADRLSAETKRLAVDGIVAYTVICTHSGCDIGDWLADEQVLYCSCHSSKFDPKDAGRVVDGPAPRSLPALPLKAVEGKLVVAGPFTARVGFESA